ncbi:MAG: 3-oxoacid CoA-transferase subunit A [Dehalococcoidales bacterium]
MSINKLVGSFDEAVADVFDGAIILIGGFGPANGSPSYLIRALERQGAKNLTLVGNSPGHGRRAPGAAPPAIRRGPPNYDNGGILIQNNQVIKAICAFPGHSRPGMESDFHKQLAEGIMSLEMVPQGTLAERIRANKAGIPAFFTPTGVGTAIGEGKETRIIDGKEYVLEYAIKADFALVRAHKADRWGNLVYQGTSRNFNGAMAGAATVTIAEVDEMVELGDLNPEGIATPSIYVNRVTSRQDSKGE